MSDLRELYQELILDHGRRPRNLRKTEPCTHHASGFNPLCGDKLELYLQVDGNTVTDAGFEGQGCAISTASASLLTENVKGRSLDEVQQTYTRFHEAVTTPSGQPVDVAPLGKLAALVGVREFPMRVKCASLAWHTLDAALNDAEEPVSTE